MKLLNYTNVVALTLTCVVGIQPALAANTTLVKPQTLIVDRGLSKTKSDAQILAAQRYGSFWNSGDEAMARAALASNFTDRTPPPGRAQGLAGPLAASKMMRAAIPDMTCEIEQMMVAGDRVIVHLRFRGHFTGRFKDIQGKGQEINFIATDIYRIVDGRITDNWHIEDNLAFLTQIGMMGN